MGIERVGLHDNFFDLGGHSLLVPRLQHRLQESLGRAIGMVDLFSYPTVAALAAHLSRGDRGERVRETTERQARRAEQGRSRLQQRRRERREIAVLKGVSDE